MWSIRQLTIDNNAGNRVGRSHGAHRHCEQLLQVLRLGNVHESMGTITMPTSTTANFVVNLAALCILIVALTKLTVTMTSTIAMLSILAVHLSAFVHLQKTITMPYTITMKVAAVNLTGIISQCTFGVQPIRNDRDYVIYHLKNATIVDANLVDSPCSALVGNRSFAKMTITMSSTTWKCDSHCSQSC